jgi:hypothetical protein
MYNILHLANLQQRERERECDSLLKPKLIYQAYELGGSCLREQRRRVCGLGGVRHVRLWCLLLAASHLIQSIEEAEHEDGGKCNRETNQPNFLLRR